jgi:hypothetical protein
MEPNTEPTESTAQNESTEQSETSTASDRHWLPVTLVVIATVIAVLSALTTWVRTQALDTDQWVSVSAELLDEPEVTEALSLYITDQLFTQVDVAGELESLLPEDFSGLAGPIAGALRGPATDGVERILESDRFAALWERANRAAHETMVRILRDETRLDSTSTADGTVTLDLGEVITNVGTTIGIPQAALDRLPDDVGTITIFESDELASVQSAVQLLDFLSWFLFLVVVALYAAAVYLARDRRPRMLRTVGLALLIGGVTVLLLRGIAIRAGVDAVVEDATRQPLAALVAGVATELLRQMGWTGVVYGILIVAFAALLGDHRWAVAIRRTLAETSTALVAAGVTAVLLILLWWSPGRALDRWVTALTLVGLLIGAGVALTKRIRDEFSSAVSER